MTDDQFFDHIDAAAYSGPSDQPPAPDIAGLLLEIEPWCEWIKARGSGISLRRHDSWHMNPNHDTILGAVCEDIEDKDWLWQLFYSNGSWRFRINTTQGDDWLFRDSRLNVAHAALLAFRDALRATRCQACLGHGEQEHYGYGTFKCPDCNGTGKAREVVCTECGSKEWGWYNKEKRVRYCVHCGEFLESGTGDAGEVA